MPTQLDGVLFAAPFVLITGDNKSPRRVDTLGDAAEALRNGEAASVAGQLRPGVLAADVDPADVGADPVLGDVVAEQMVAWCLAHGVPYYLRESGRPGGRHVLAVARSTELVEAWDRLCRDLGHRYGVPVAARTGMALRLLTAPHRSGLPAPLLGGTLTPADAEHVLDHLPTIRRSGRSRRAASGQPGTGQPDRSRSAREFGQACAMVRAGYSPARAWGEQAVPGSKARERGQLAWRRYVWLAAVTTVAAEQGVTEPDAWRLAQHACRSRCQQLGLSGWREALWKPACRDAARDRPRRYRIHPTHDQDVRPDDDAELEILRRGLLTAADDLLTQRGEGSRRRSSAAAAIYHLAPALQRRDGSLDIRTWAETACLDPKTIRTVRDILIQVGIIEIAHHYSGGARDCSRYRLGPATQPYLDAARSNQDANSPTSCSTPPDAPPSGQANRSRLLAAHTRDRQNWRLRCSLSALTEGMESSAASTHAAARTLRSMWFQRRWWASLSPEQQEQRRKARRAELGRRHRSERSAWFDWLNVRAGLTASADRLHAGHGTGADLQALSTAPTTVHRGMRGDDWRTRTRLTPQNPDAALLAA